ncbi:hypothetical protein LTSEADE_0190, partial [Salmonella enterica subsp. enterica serovar Adelaide str. A4-669]
SIQIYYDIQIISAGFFYFGCFWMTTMGRRLNGIYTAVSVVT